MDPYGLSRSVPSRVFNSFVRTNISLEASTDTLIETEIGECLDKLDILRINKKDIYIFIENSPNYIGSLNTSEELSFLTWLMEFSGKVNESELSFYRFAKLIPDENNELQTPEDLFFPSDFSEGEDVVEDAKTINKSLYMQIPVELKSWLVNLGVKEISKLTLIEKVLCSDGGITIDNAIQAIRFIFKTNLTENIFINIPEYKLKNIKLLTSDGNLKSPSELYLSEVYHPMCDIQQEYLADIFVSTSYLAATDDPTLIREWSLFFKKLGVSDDIQLCSIDYTSGSWVMNNSIIQENVELAKRTEYVHSYWNGNDYYLGCAGGVRVTALSSPFFAPANFRNQTEKNIFFKKVWERIFCGSIPSQKDDYIYGRTGNGYSARGYLADSRYLGKSFIEWVAGTQKKFPASDGELHNANEVLPYSNANIETFGLYFPVSLVENITEEWVKRIKFKEKLTLNDYLIVLDRISKDESKEQIRDNTERITRIYDRIADGGYDLVEGSPDFNILRNWGQTHKILSSKNEFEYPSELYLLSSKLSGVELDNQAYHRKSQENDRFASLMIALGVNMITNHRVEGLENAVAQDLVKDSLMKRVEFFTALTTDGNISKLDWDETVEKIRESISVLRFYSVPSIHVIYGRQSIEKVFYVSNTDLYYVGKFGLAVQELLHRDIVRLIGLHKNDSSTFLTLMRMSDFDEMVEYLQFKGYNTEYISRPMLPDKVDSDSSVIMKEEDAPNGELSNEQKRVYLEEAKDAILHQLSCDGFDTSNYKWDGWTCIDGVKKDGKEYPLVIRSNKSGRNTVLSASDWDQLMKTNAMFVVNTNLGIGTVNFKQLLRSRDNITIRFGSENIDEANRISKLAEAFAFFKGMQFDFESYIRPTISRWQSFMAPELETGEQAGANPSIPLPE